MKCHNKEPSEEVDIRQELIIEIKRKNTAKALELVASATLEELSKIDEDGTVLHYAAFANLEQVCVQLIDNMSLDSISAVDKHNNTALHHAAYNSMENVCLLLINSMTLESLDIIAKDGDRALHQIVESKMPEEVCSQLIGKINKEAVGATNKYGYTALHLAANTGSIEIYGLLISNMNEDAINAINKHGDTALHLAADVCSTEACKLLIPHMNEDTINTINKIGNTALHVAAGRDNKAVCNLLIAEMPTKQIVCFLNRENDYSSFQEVVSNIVNDSMSRWFCGESYQCYYPKLLKLYQAVDKGLFPLQTLTKSQNCNLEAQINNYIARNYFQLIGVCKVINPESGISILAKNTDCMSEVLSYLVPYSLLPESSLVCLSGATTNFQSDW